MSYLQLVPNEHPRPHHHHRYQTANDQPFCSSPVSNRIFNELTHLTRFIYRGNKQQLTADRQCGQSLNPPCE